MAFDRIASIFVPALCVACQGPAADIPANKGDRYSAGACRNLLCRSCLLELEEGGPICGDPPPGIDGIVSCAAHEGVARSVLAAFKFRRLYEVGLMISSRMAFDLGEGAMHSLVVPVPASPVRLRLRGFDSAEDLSMHLFRMLGGAHISGAIRRVGTGRQRGRGRAGRLGSPPDIRLSGAVPKKVLLVDDVVTTGATLSACAAVLRSGGATSVSAVTFTRRL